jgi:hypothetical protein
MFTAWVVEQGRATTIPFSLRRATAGLTLGHAPRITTAMLHST